ncbi:MAG: TIGR00730 family Rossman fold protein [Clostridiales bacterium]|nr:TIGR00730 family Rossman fold protein [Clostridiales bacterium]
MNNTFLKNICIFGASSDRIDKVYLDAAFLTGRLLALAEYGLVFGAGDSGVMGAAARGAREAGGRITGVIPEKLNRKGIYFEGCTERIETKTMHERKSLMEDLSCGFIALAGGYGTIEEFMEVLTLKQLKYFDKPIVLLNTDGYFDPLIRQLERCVFEGFTSKAHGALYFVAKDPYEAVGFCVNYKGMEIKDKLPGMEG